MEKDRFFLAQGESEKPAENLFLFFPGSLEGKIKTYLSQSHAAGKFLFDETQMGFGIDPFQTPGMKTHGWQDEVRKTTGQVENFFIRCQVRPDPDDPLNPGILGPLQGSFEVLDLIQVSMGIDEFE
jgi:hypothetical protein